ncbi:MAG: acyl carrier protein [Candidatus Latescibacteria bacterium]|nr:acyl carrier protein [Candidatus Latescibacterota bacterium]
MQTEHSIEDRIKELIVQILELEVNPSEIEDDDLLFGGEIGLDSTATLELTAGIEETFGIRIGDEELITALFESVDSLTKFIKEKLAVQGKMARKDST